MNIRMQSLVSTYLAPQFSIFRVHENYYLDDIYLIYIVYQRKNRLDVETGRYLNSAAYVMFRKETCLASTLRGKELKNREDNNLPNVFQ